MTCAYTVMHHVTISKCVFHKEIFYCFFYKYFSIQYHISLLHLTCEKIIKFDVQNFTQTTHSISFGVWVILTIYIEYTKTISIKLNTDRV